MKRTILLLCFCCVILSTEAFARKQMKIVESTIACTNKEPKMIDYFMLALGDAQSANDSINDFSNKWNKMLAVVTKNRCLFLPRTTDLKAELLKKEKTLWHEEPFDYLKLKIHVNGMDKDYILWTVSPHKLPTFK